MGSADRSAGTVAIALVATTAVQALVTMATLTMSILAPRAAQDIGIPAENIGFYASIVYVGAMVGSLTAGGFVLRFGAIRFSQIAMLTCAVGLVIGVGAHWSLLLVSALVCGLGYGPTTPASSHILSRHTPPRFLSLVFSIKQTGVPLGGLIAGLLIPLFLVWFDWQGAMWAVTATVLLGLISLQPTRRRFDSGLEAGAPLLKGNIIGPLRLVFSRRELRILIAGSFLFAALQQCYTYFLVTFLQTDIGWSNQKAGLALSVLGASGVVGRVLWGAVADATGRSDTVLAFLAFGMAASAAITAMITPDWSDWSVLAICAAFGLTGIAWNGVYLAEVSRRVAPEEASRATGGGLFVTFSGVVIGPAIFGLITQVTGGFSAGYLILAAATAAAGLPLLRTRKTS